MPYTTMETSKHSYIYNLHASYLGTQHSKKISALRSLHENDMEWNSKDENRYWSSCEGICKVLHRIPLQSGVDKDERKIEKTPEPILVQGGHHMGGYVVKIPIEFYESGTAARTHEGEKGRQEADIVVFW